MRLSPIASVRVLVLLACVFALGGGPSAPSTQSPDAPILEFTPERWSLDGAQASDHLGRKALAGAAYLKDAAFEDGVIDVDVAVTGEWSYPGVLFRIASPGNHERVYLRPHRSNAARYPDVVQYVPGFSGVDSWQLYNGEGTIDGIQPDGDGSLLVTHNEGRLFRVSKDGKVTLLVDGTTVQESLADIGYVPEKRMVVAPTFTGNGVVAYRLP